METQRVTLKLGLRVAKHRVRKTILAISPTTKRKQYELGEKVANNPAEKYKHMARKQTSAWTYAAVILWFIIAVMGFIVIPALIRYRINQLQSKIDILEYYMVKTNRNMGVLDNKLNTLHDQLGGQIDCTYQVVPQEEGTVN